MATVVIRLDPQLLDNPDADLRYRLPAILAELSMNYMLTKSTLLAVLPSDRIASSASTRH